MRQMTKTKNHSTADRSGRQTQKITRKYRAIEKTEG
jgi:hypothetical protein